MLSSNGFNSFNMFNSINGFNTIYAVNKFRPFQHNLLISLMWSREKLREQGQSQSMQDPRGQD